LRWKSNSAKVYSLLEIPPYFFPALLDRGIALDWDLIENATFEIL